MHLPGPLGKTTVDTRMTGRLGSNRHFTSPRQIEFARHWYAWKQRNNESKEDSSSCWLMFPLQKYDLEPSLADTNHALLGKATGKIDENYLLRNHHAPSLPIHHSPRSPRSPGWPVCATAGGEPFGSQQFDLYALAHDRYRVHGHHQLHWGGHRGDDTERTSHALHAHADMLRQVDRGKPVLWTWNFHEKTWNLSSLS